jgi:hypothetical protein
MLGAAKFNAPPNSAASMYQHGHDHPRLAVKPDHHDEILNKI